MRLIQNSLLIVAIVLPARSLAAQASAEADSVENAAAAYIAGHFVKGRVLFDTANVPNPGAADAGGRTAAENRRLASTIGAAKIGLASESRQCLSPKNAQCDVVGFDVVISLSRVAIRGDTAVIAVRRFSHGIPGQPVMTSANYRLQLARRGTHWVVVEARPTSIS